MTLLLPSRVLRDFQRFWTRVEVTDGCWLWRGSCDPRWGYGYLSLSTDGVGRTVKAHRFSYEVFIGPISDETKVLHECDNPPCVRPHHLHLGDHQANMDEMYKRGRGNKVRGEAHHGAKLTENDVREIRRIYEKGSRTHGTLALGRRYGVAKGVIWKIVKRRSWTHVPEDSVIPNSKEEGS